MDELEQIDKINEGFKKLIKRIDDLGPQTKSTQEHLDIMKKSFKMMINMGNGMKAFLKKVGVEEIKRGLGKNSIQQDLKFIAKSLAEAERNLTDWEALIKKDSKIYH